MKKIIFGAIALIVALAPAARANDAAVEGMLREVGDIMQAAGYGAIAPEIRTGRLGQHVVEMAFDICQDRALGSSDEEIFGERSRGYSQTTAEGQQDTWLLQSVMIAADEEYCEAIGADEYES